MTRRTFFQTAASAPALFGTPAKAPVPGILDIGNTKQLFLDNLLLAETSRISRIVARPQKYSGNPILIPDRPWEQPQPGSRVGGIQISGQSVMYDPDERLFKMWYVATGGEHDTARHWCYAVSNDGYRWEKPDLSLYGFNGSRHNNRIYPDEWHGGGYFNAFKDPHDPDPRRRYKALGAGKLRNNSSGLIVAFSPDGVHWTDHPRNPLIPLGREIADVPTMLGWDPRLRKYVYYPRPGHTLAYEFTANGAHSHLRTVGYSLSDDFEHWSPNVIMLAPDDRVDWQYYQLTAALYGDFYVGLLAMHETYDQTFDIFLLSSRDGFHWNWIERGVPFLSHGEVGAYDGGYLTPSGPIVHGDQIWIYYGAYSGAHSGVPNKLGLDHMTVALATLPLDRWVGLLAGPNQGTIITRPLLFQGSKLVADIGAGLPIYRSKNGHGADECEFRAAVLDQSGGRIEGFTADRCKPLTESGAQELSWERADLSRLQGKPIRVWVEMRNAALYSMQFRGGEER